MKMNLLSKAFLFTLVAGLLGACGQLIPPSEPTTFFRVTQSPIMTKEIVAPALNSKNIRLGVGPVQIPGYADRPQIVSEGESGKLIVDDLNHWAEPLHDNLERVMVSNLGSMLGAERVYPFPTSFHPDKESLQVAIEIREMIKQKDGKVRLLVSWNVKRLLDNSLLVRGSANFVSNETAVTYGDYANSISAMLMHLSKKILRSIEPKI